MISSTQRRKLGKNQGTYALVIYLSRATTIHIGALGAFKFPRGYYLYIGSAMNGLAARIARYLRQDKKTHWHIDYFLARALVKEVWTHRGTERFEHAWAQTALALPNAKVIAPRFGASDCKCATHLVYLGGYHKK
jgi:Uri superfamily endonuclease